MRYSELLEKYRQGKLNQEEQQQVEADIERQEAISEYLFDREEMEGEVLGREGMEERESEDFVKMINCSIRRAFLKMGISVALVTVGISLFVFFGLPELVDGFYYDPGETVGEEGNRISLDMAVYTELLVPGCNRDNVNVSGRGYGRYDIVINQNVSYNRQFTNLSGRIEKGQLTLYVNNVLARPTGNAFAWYQMEGDSSDSLQELIETQGKYNSCAAGNVEQANETLAGLSENETYIAYVTLDKMMPYEEFMSFVEGSQTAQDMGAFWCAVCTENGVEEIDTSQNGMTELVDGEVLTRRSMFMAQNIGFNFRLTASHDLDWDREKYPALLLWDNKTLREQELQGTVHEDTRALSENMKQEQFMKTHFVSMLRYIAAQKEFLVMMKESAEVYSSAADYVEEHGIMVYGFAGIGQKEDILALNEEAAVYEIYVNELK